MPYKSRQMPPIGVVSDENYDSETTESLVDLSPGDGNIVPLATVLRVPALGEVRTVPLTQARVPVALNFTMVGDSEAKRVGVRAPADVVITGGYELDNDDVFVGAGLTPPPKTSALQEYS